MIFVSTLIGVLMYWLTVEMLDDRDDLDVIMKCLPNTHFIRDRRKKLYRSYQFVGEFTKDYDTKKLENLLSNYLGKPVRVYFDRVLTIRVYKHQLPRKVELPKDLKKGISQVCVGIGLDGPVYHNFLKFPHMIIAGHTGYGKTNFLKTIISQIDREIVLIDLKGSKDYMGFGRVFKEIYEVKRILGWVVKEMRTGRWEKEHMFVVVDEAAELLAPSYLTRKESEDYLACQWYISEIARLGRSLGVHLLYCTQYPTADILPRQVKQNAETRVVFRLPTAVASKVALDETGAEHLQAGLSGRCLFKNDVVKEIQTFEWKGMVENVEIRDSEKTRVRDYYSIG